MAASYVLAWSVYLGALAVALVLLWLGMRHRVPVNAQRVTLLCLFAFLVVPARLEPGSDYWAPAFMAALMEAIDEGVDAALDRLWPAFLFMLVLVVLSVLWRLWQFRKGTSRTPG